MDARYSPAAAPRAATAWPIEACGACIANRSSRGRQVLNFAVLLYSCGTVWKKRRQSRKTEPSGRSTAGAARRWRPFWCSTAGPTVWAATAWASPSAPSWGAPWCATAPAAACGRCTAWPRATWSRASTSSPWPGAALWTGPTTGWPRPFIGPAGSWGCWSGRDGEISHRGYPLLSAGHLAGSAPPVPFCSHLFPVRPGSHWKVRPLEGGRSGCAAFFAVPPLL